MYLIKLCIGIPDDSSTGIEYKMLDTGLSYTDYIDAKQAVDRLISINGTDSTAIDFWISTYENTQS